MDQEKEEPKSNRPMRPGKYGGMILDGVAGPGMPKGMNTGPKLKTIMKRLLETGVTPEIQKQLAEKLGLPIERYEDAVSASQIITAIKGGPAGVSAFTAIRDTVDGKPMQRLEHSHVDRPRTLEELQEEQRQLEAQLSAIEGVDDANSGTTESGPHSPPQ